MKYRKLGNTGLIVSELALGLQFSGKMNMGNLGQDATTEMVKLAYDRGINFIDTADVYSLGESESNQRVGMSKVMTLVVEMFEGHAKNLIFRASATDTLSNNLDKNIKSLDKNVQKMFGHFPPLSKK